MSDKDILLACLLKHYIAGIAPISRQTLMATADNVNVAEYIKTSLDWLIETKQLEEIEGYLYKCS